MAIGDNTTKIVIALGSAFLGVVGTITVAWIQRGPAPKPVPSQDLVPKATQGESQWIVRSETDRWDWVDSWVNNDCRPKDMSGIELISLQKGNGQPYTLYVLCRKDGNNEARYGVRMTPKSDDVLTSVRLVLGNSNARIGPYYFSSDGHGGAFWYVERTGQ